jgi:hypothetical protein
MKPEGARMQTAEETLRRTVRWSTEERGTVWVDGRAIKCEIVDLTVAGAHISMQAPELLPQRFELEHNGKRSKVRIVWQRVEAVSVEFVRPFEWLRKLGVLALLRRPPRPLL